MDYLTNVNLPPKLQQCTDKIIYAGNIKEQIRNKVYYWDFKKAVNGHYPINGDRYSIFEFANLVSPESLNNTNPNYLGCQYITDSNEEIWWVFYVPVEKLEKFNRIDPHTNSSAITHLILSLKEWKPIYINLECRKNTDAMGILIWRHDDTQKLILTRTCMGCDDHANRVIRNASIEAILPSKYDPGFTSVYTQNIFFEDNNGALSYCPKWKDTIGIGLEDNSAAVGEYVYKHINSKYLNLDL